MPPEPSTEAFAERTRHKEVRSPMPERIQQKWGFGMAPPKNHTLTVRNAACQKVLDLLRFPDPPEPNNELLDAVSQVKGLFMRVARQDQWDWFTVAGQLGYPSTRLARVVAHKCYTFRSAIKSGDPVSYGAARTNLLRLPTRRCLAVHLGQAKIANEADAGWIYVLSTRDLPELLKVGMTTRSVEQRANEINGATGVAIPFGVRRCWRVFQPARAEKIAHQTLQEYRLRKDREFFRLPFNDAVRLLQHTIEQSNLEIRTLNALAGLEHDG